MLARRDGVSENRIQMNSKKNAEILFLEHDCTWVKKIAESLISSREENKYRGGT